jgi:restriction system protein
MKNKSLIEEMLEVSIKNPAFGIVMSIILAVAGFFLTNKEAPVGAKPADAMLLPLWHLFGKVSYILSVLVLVVAGVGYIVSTIKKKKQEDFFGTRETLNDLKNLSWKEFEEYVGSLFAKLGYTVEVTGGLQDGGIDLIVRKEDRISLVQCKNYRVNKVTLSMVRDFYGAMNANLNFEVGYFITTGIFTLDAKHFAEDKPIELVDGARLIDYVRMATSKEQIHGNRDRSWKSSSKEGIPDPSESVKSPICPKCGVKMVLRTAQRGNNIGSQFWGCSKYPKCKATKLVTSL